MSTYKPYKPYKRELSNGSYFLVNPNTSKEKLLVCEYGGDKVRISHKSKTVSLRKLKTSPSGKRYFVYKFVEYRVC